jgi:hypothetical protein
LSQAQTRAPLAASARHAERPERPSPSTAAVLPCMEGTGIIAAQRSLRVERPINASTMAMIQKRITMVGSCQPFCSK